MSMHRLDWSNKPLPFKIYEGLPKKGLPVDFELPSADALDALCTRGEGGGLDARTLSQALYCAAGITKKVTLPDGEDFLFRAAASAGALYPVEVYVVCGDIPGLGAGVYHFSPRDFSLTRLREGDLRGYLAAAAEEPLILEAPATLVLTSIYWRSSWKYRARAYRYCFWDSGTILANLLATAASSGLRTRVVAGFLDEAVHHLIGIDGEREGCVCLIPLGESGEHEAVRSQEPPPLRVNVVTLSTEEVDYPEIRRLHRASQLGSPDELRAWKGPLSRERPAPTGRCYPLTTGGVEGRPLGEVIRRRGSTRKFRRAAIRLEELSTILRTSTRGFDADFLKGPESSLLDIYLIVNAVEGVPSGAYYYHPDEDCLELLKEGAFRNTAGFLCLEQTLAADASAVVFLLSDLQAVLQRYGNRGYRIAQLEAGTVGGRMYLAAYSLGLGATGLTFYDDEVTTFFEPHAQGKDAIFVVALGRAAKVRSTMVPVEMPGRMSES
jgi:SagB-type dehydrogenase family enzyme